MALCNRKREADSIHKGCSVATSRLEPYSFQGFYSVSLWRRLLRLERTYPRSFFLNLNSPHQGPYLRVFFLMGQGLTSHLICIMSSCCTLSSILSKWTESQRNGNHFYHQMLRIVIKLLLDFLSLQIYKLSFLFPNIYGLNFTEVRRLSLMRLTAVSSVPAVPYTQQSSWWYNHSAS